MPAMNADAMIDGNQSAGSGDGDGGCVRVDGDVGEVRDEKLVVVEDARFSSIEGGRGDVGNSSGGVGLVRGEGIDGGGGGGGDVDVDGKVAVMVSEVKEESCGGFVVTGDDINRLQDGKGGHDVENGRFRDNRDGGDTRITIDGEVDERKVAVGREDDGWESRKTSSAAQGYTSFMSEFDEYVVNEKNNLAESSALNALRYGYKVGEMVWGKVKSHPWWPGHILNEAFASSSVRKSRREGSVLVAFFGDSSYGWFDPSELIPFEPNFTEKSQQTASRAFIKAVEEAVDEAGRRRGLGLTCKCRNAYNFRPTGVRGYFAVDVPDYEPGAVYSVGQITRARESFKPSEALSFVKQLALAPKHGDSESLDAIENKAMVFAYRKAIFEEFDETYSQAFGVQAARPSYNPADVQLVKEPPRAPLSGPLVIAEALGGTKSSTKSVKGKDHSKKEKYLLKRRDDSHGHQIIHAPGPPLSFAVSKEGSTALAAGGYMLQKRAASAQVNSDVPGNFEQTQSAAGANLCQKYTGQDAPSQLLANRTSVTGHMSANAQSSGDFRGPLPKPEETASGIDVVSPSYGPDFTRKGVVPVPANDVKMYDYQASVMPSEINLFRKVEGGRGQNHVPDSLGGAYHNLADAKRTKFKADGAVKKTKKVLVGSGSDNVGVKKKLKRKEMDSEAVSGKPKKHLLSGKVGALAAKSVGKTSQIDTAKKVDGKSSSSASSRSLPITASGKDLRSLLTSLQAIAVDPKAVEKSGCAVTKRVFLGFRNLVYEKSLVLAPPIETDSAVVHPAKPQAEIGDPDQPSARIPKTGVPNQHSVGVIKKQPPVKSVKPTGRQDESVKWGGQKRAPSDRQEEIEAKRMKKLKDLKSLAAENRAARKVQDAPLREGKEIAPAAPRKSAKALQTKKIEPSRARVSAPTMLVMKFPLGITLPSVPELKARFARFGPLDYSSIRVFWKSSTCRVVFQHKSDAQAAYNYAVGNSSLFGNASVRYHIRDAGALASETAEATKSSADDSVNETPRLREPLGMPAHPQAPLSTLQLKSCLKRPTGDDTGPVAGNGSRGARVKFILGDEGSSRPERTTTGNSNGCSPSIYADGAPSSSSSSVGMVINSKSLQRPVGVVPVEESSSSSYHNPPLRPHPHFQVTNAPETEIAQPPLPRNPLRQNYSVGALQWQQQAANVSRVDISQQMISLLTRCNDVVNNLSGLLGYVPYHSL